MDFDIEVENVLSPKAQAISSLMPFVIFGTLSKALTITPINDKPGFRLFLTLETVSIRSLVPCME